MISSAIYLSLMGCWCDKIRFKSDWQRLRSLNEVHSSDIFGLWSETPSESCYMTNHNEFSVASVSPTIAVTRMFIPKHLTRKLLPECFHRLKPGIISSTSSPSVQRHRKICLDPETTWTTNVLQNVAGSHKSLLRHARIALIAFLLCYFHGRLKRIYLEQTKSRWRLPRKLLLCFWRK